jgi:hypothetical protein
MICVKLPWTSQFGVITIRRKKSGFLAVIKGETLPRHPQKPGKLTIRGEMNDPKEAYNLALRNYLDANGNFEDVRFDAIQFHEMFGYILVHEDSGHWDYVPMTDERVRAHHLPHIDKRRTHIILQLLLQTAKLTPRSLEGWMRNMVAMGAGFNPPITPIETLTILQSPVSAVLRLRL